MSMGNAISISSLKTRIDAVARGLESPLARIEGIFLKVGSELLGCAELLQRVTTQFESLPEDLNSSALDESTDRLSHVGQRASAIAAEMGTTRDELGRLSKALSVAASPISQLRRTVKMMGIVATNARVGAASLVEKGDDFGAFADDVSALSSSMAATVAEFSMIYEKLTAVVAEAAHARSQFISSQRGPLAAVARGLAKMLDAVTAQRRDAVERSAETSRMSKSIADKVGHTVMAMQSGDSVRQRLEHVEAALRHISQDQVDTEVLHAFLELERLQLAGAREMLTEEMDSADIAVTQLAVDAVALLDQAKLMHGTGEDKHSALDELRRGVKEAISVLQRYEVERQKLDRVAAEVSSTVIVLLNHVESVEKVEQKMRIVSLNAAIKCSQLDQRGRALNVIAQQLRDLTKDTVASATESITKLRDAAKISAEFAEALAKNDAKAVVALEAEAGSALELLGGVSGRLNQALSDLSRDVPRVKHKLHHVSTLLGESGSITSDLADAEFVLVELGAASGNLASHADFFSTLRRGYTMEAERQIHDTYTGLEPGEGTAEHGSPIASSGDDGLESLLF